jgi:hypothetical protein
MIKSIHVLISIASFALIGCSSAPGTPRVAGDMNGSGGIQPCSDRRDAQACGNAVFNATVIAQIHKGQSRGDVRGIMRHDAERHETQGLTESWGYLTSYKNQMITWITFTADQVSSLSHEQLVRD